MPWVGRAQRVRHVLAVPPGEWLLQSAASGELGRTINIIRRREAGGEVERSGADAVVVSTEGPIDEQVRRIVGPEGIEHAIDPVVGEIGTQMLSGTWQRGPHAGLWVAHRRADPGGADPRYILAGRRILEVFWLGY